MKKIWEKFKQLFKRFCVDKKFNNVCLGLLELPLLIIGFITSNYALILWGVISLAIFNFLIKKLYVLALSKKIKKMIIENKEKGGAI